MTAPKSADDFSSRKSLFLFTELRDGDVCSRERNSSRFVCAITKLEFWKWNAHVLTLLGECCFWIKHVWLFNKQHTCWVINNFEMTSFFPSFPSHWWTTVLFKINIKSQSLLISDIDSNRNDGVSGVNYNIWVSQLLLLVASRGSPSLSQITSR